MTAPVAAKEALKDASTKIAAELAADAGDQAELFAIPCDDPKGEIEEARRTGLKGGRPKGAQNLMTRELREYLARRMGGTPQEHLAKWFLLGPAGLAKALHCDLLEAFDRWNRLGVELGRYFMAPMAAADDQGKVAPTFLVTIGGGSGAQAADGSELPPWEYMSEQNQGLAAIEGERSKDQAEGEGEK